MATGLDRLAALDDDELDALIEIAQARASGALSRRDLLKAGGTLGALGLVGGSAVGSSAADASTSDSDSNAGRPSDRVDVFADGVDANSVSTDEEVIGQVQRRVPALTIADDAADSITFSKNRGALISVYDVSANRFGLFATVANAVDSAGTQAITNLGGQQLTGTTGTDGDLSVSRDADTFYIENRTGGQITVHVDVKDLV